ncbi:TetR/AcrR family transcriptional regulator [Microbacterium sp. CR_7]|uniref:TetR/AcrR family transcriptional regulator n=1 Tax=Microbacterium sp. CR_7 TaxID=3055792 RepID=UPI0035BF499B
MNEEEAGTRDRILRAAVSVAQSGAKVTVRAVAARAGVGMGTLRYHFRTQRELLDAVLSSLYEEALPDERIRDASVPAEDRLVECLQHLLTPVGTEHQARQVWADLYHAFIALDAAPDARAGYIELHRQAARRVESWLSILVEEGALERGDNASRALLLLAVINGLAVQRALPADRAPLETEAHVLRAAVASLPFM